MKVVHFHDLGDRALCGAYRSFGLTPVVAEVTCPACKKILRACGRDLDAQYATVAKTTLEGIPKEEREAMVAKWREAWPGIPEKLLPKPDGRRKRDRKQH